MREFVLQLDEGKVEVIKNLRRLWIERNYILGGWGLFFEDDIYERNLIYRSKDRLLLERISQIISNAYAEGKNIVRV